MAAVVDGLYALGHRRIAHIAGLPGLAHAERRIRTLRAEAERRGLSEVQSVPTDYSEEAGATVTRRVLDGPGAPTALIYDNDVMAVAGVAAAAERASPCQPTFRWWPGRTPPRAVRSSRGCPRCRGTVWSSAARRRGN